MAWLPEHPQAPLGFCVSLHLEEAGFSFLLNNSSIVLGFVLFIKCYCSQGWIEVKPLQFLLATAFVKAVHSSHCCTVKGDSVAGSCSPALFFSLLCVQWRLQCSRIILLTSLVVVVMLLWLFSLMPAGTHREPVQLGGGVTKMGIFSFMR